ncbi:hypothetical protein ACFSYH_05865 [Populibacterium corticicola]|uniref:Minor tail protein n=1 Tax=Populibacterium corticicola TaxID=1812826 RepID=A0ABW5XEF6_9MICO
MKLEILAPTSDAFVLGRTRLAHVLTALDGAQAWTDYTCDGTAITITRGGDRDPASTRLGPGVLTLTTRAPEPVTDPALMPGRMVRVTQPAIVDWTEHPFYGDPSQPWWDVAPGHFFHPTASTTPDGLVTDWYTDSTGNAVPVLLHYGTQSWPPTGQILEVRLRATGDPIQVHTVDGFVTLTGEWTWYQVPRDTWFALVFTTARNRAGTVSVWGLRWVPAGTPTRETIFTGVLKLPQITPSVEDGKYTTTVTAHDRMSALAAQMRYGVVSGNASGTQSLKARLVTLLESIGLDPAACGVTLADPVPDLLGKVIPASPTGVSGYRVDRVLESGQVRITAHSLNTPPATLPAQAFGVRHTLTGLVPDQPYQVAITMRLQSGLVTEYSLRRDTTEIASIVLAPALDGGGFQTLTATFTATATSHTLTLANRASYTFPTAPTQPVADLYVARLLVAGGEGGDILTDVVYESNLANHFALACDSGQMLWHATKDYALRFQESPRVMPYEFSDVHTTDRYHVCYSDLDMAFDDTALVNALTISQHGRKYDADQGGWYADDYTRSFTEQTSQATYGDYATSVDTCLYTGPGYEGQLRSLASTILTAQAYPRMTPRSLTFDATEFFEASGRLDLNDQVNITRAGVTYPCIITGMQRRSTPRRGRTPRDLLTLTLWSIHG